MIVAQVLTSTLAIVPSGLTAIRSNRPSDLVASTPARSRRWQTKYSPARPTLMARRSLNGFRCHCTNPFLSVIFVYLIRRDVVVNKPDGEVLLEVPGICAHFIFIWVSGMVCQKD